MYTMNIGNYANLAVTKTSCNIDLNINLPIIVVKPIACELPIGPISPSYLHRIACISLTVNEALYQTRACISASGIHVL